MTDDVSTLNSRTELWAASVKYVLARPILGVGYFASRYLLMKEFPWAGHAHNSFLEVLITTGVVGLLILLAFVFYVIRKSIKTRNPLLLGVTLYCLIQGMMNPLIFTPGLAMFVLTIAVLAAGLEDQAAPAVRHSLWEGNHMVDSPVVSNDGSQSILDVNIQQSCGAAIRVKPKARLCEPWVMVS